MLPVPKKYFITAASAEGKSKLTAFDNALLKAGIGNVNLVRVSSILPPEAEFAPGMKIPPGSLVPTAYGSIVSEIPGETISAAIAVGVSEESFGVIMEFTGKCSKEEAEATITRMVKEAFEVRAMELKEIKVNAVEHKVEKIGCAFAAAPLWY
ncbi:arginine decarboxylase, pyruvoyl-dependent [Heliorestis acidaminivorans]|uniref:Pyruvoyl-dependent arginine decarboxylase AaxB n=1 Tax=Heliorestis acidaminivorans TaxID=553427 RepID=A0A6I0F151_9FIRM|nr:arginine decarboxylase, pyruvoyl-dependent [Heliorestis acidaminivorans]KAB2951860.1 arginine decarboxylase, pyruvoyl-dependent [Heliorestis acidaminivorans]